MMLLNISITIFTFFAMEFVAWFTHKYIMHGILWNVHLDHHQVDKNKKIQKNDLNSRKGKVVVMGSSSILTNKRLKENTGNRFLTKNIINWMIEERGMLDIEPKSISTYNINLNEREYVNLLYALSVIPISTALIGLFVGWLRKEL
jgi:hypothetical protein